MLSPMELRDATALVTGANGGIGAAIARALHRAGAKVIVSGRRADALAPLAAELGARVIVADLNVRADVDRCMDEAGPLDVLVANAGLPSSGFCYGFSPEQIERVLDVNLRAPMLMARRLIDGMIEKKRGHLVFISSTNGKVAIQGSSVYSATKFGLRGFALGLRQDLIPHGVGVTTIYPGFIREAGMFADSGVKLPAGAGTRSPDDVARAVLKAIRSNPAEIDVAAIDQRFGTFLFKLSPQLLGWITRKLGAKTLKQISAAQADKR
jgi:NADP-dependent 3-hydroxy acid dehydrogenase YdfG